MTGKYWYRSLTGACCISGVTYRLAILKAEAADVF
jgi:hypothetical protein